jgi:L-histidine N-alpha-methyltransferase
MTDTAHLEPIPPVIDVHLTADDLRAAMERDVREGLSAEPRQLPPVYFYDDRGSRLFDDITRLPEYYPTRAERAVLEAHAKDIAMRSGATMLVELGAGTCDKTRVLLDAMAANGTLTTYVPLDVSDTVLAEAAHALAADYPGLAVHAVVGDFHAHLDRLPAGRQRLFAFLGGTIGNLDPAQRRRFLCELDCAMDRGDRLLIGTDLVKDRSRLVAAYDDDAGVTAEFNRNVLHVLNRELGADFATDAFAHVARWNEDDSRIEMWLRATEDQRIRVRDLDLDIEFSRGDELLTEISSKFTPDGLRSELFDCGFVVDDMWLSPGDEFLVTMASPYC